MQGLRGRRPSRIVLATVVALALAAGGGAAWLAATSELQDVPTVAAALALLVGWSFVGSGLVAWHERPANRIGPLMVLIGFAWFGVYLADARDPWAFTIGTAVENVYLIGFVLLLLSLPRGRLNGRGDQVLFASAIAVAGVLELAWLVFADSGAIICADCPPNRLQLVRDDDLAQGLLDAQRAVGACLSALTVVILVRRWRRASRPQRQAVAPVLWAGSAFFAALVVAIVNDILGEPVGAATDWATACAFAAVPFAVLAVILQRRLARGAVAGLVVELGDAPQRAGLREALRRALGDPSLELAYWLPERARYVDGAGTAVELPAECGSRTVTIVERDGVPVAALVHDPALGENPGLVDSVCAAAGLALENERLQAELRMRLEELRASRVRIVEATEAERRRIERDLHDGAQQRLVSAVLTLGLAESLLEREPAAVAPELRETKESLLLALRDLRELSHGIHPSILTERGLPAALEDLAGRATLPVRLDVSLAGRLPERVEAAAYFVVSEALANVAKHAGARRCAVTAAAEGGTLRLAIADDGRGGACATGGSGLRGLADRVETLGGRLAVDSPAGAGTVLRVEIPCA